MKHSIWVRMGSLAAVAFTFATICGTRLSLAKEADWDAIDQQITELPQDPGEESGAIQSEIDGATDDPSEFQVSASPPGSASPAASAKPVHQPMLPISPRIQSPQGSYRMYVQIFKRPRGLNVDKEFGVVEVDGKLRNIFAVSTAIPGHYTVEGTFKLKIGKRGKYPYPWIRSASYGQSPMYWGLEITDNSYYWIHSTPHYAQLGMPASMGCVRVDLPTAMELWDEAVNYVKGSSVITLYGSGSAAALGAYKELKSRYGLTDARVRELIQEDLDDAHAIARGDYRGTGHWRRDPGRVFPRFKTGYYPKCLGKSCFSIFGQRMRVK